MTRWHTHSAPIRAPSDPMNNSQLGQPTAKGILLRGAGPDMILMGHALRRQNTLPTSSPANQGHRETTLQSHAGIDPAPHSTAMWQAGSSTLYVPPDVCYTDDLRAIIAGRAGGYAQLRMLKRLGQIAFQRNIPICPVSRGGRGQYIPMAKMTMDTPNSKLPQLYLSFLQIPPPGKKNICLLMRVMNE
ncbi:hypothetical protein C7212DRAFT_347570 [Tuber magnatum]|uniref:Uncharacterized protein n=1 Tax=Tuber magnatum TaxID=42249 RepID=A0A317SJN2_9PEZI|nr:hypothetical protein C7212DRAFT_347570 [Tuber magnatum]